MIEALSGLPCLKAMKVSVQRLALEKKPYVSGDMNSYQHPRHPTKDLPLDLK